MTDNLNYQQARAIRKTKFSDLYLDALSQKGTGVFGALGKTISLRSQAKTKGLKEKFDPLNIVKFLTFGSKIGPALYGKMAGRDQKDIDYFTGRARHVTGGRNTADKIKGTGNGDDAGMNEQLAKIFTFLKSNREDDVKLREEAKNHEEEINMEKDRRHKELVKTLEKLMKQIGQGGGTATATKQNGPSFMDGLLDKIKGLAELLSNLKSLVFDIAKQIGGPIMEALKAGGRYAAMGLEAAALSGGLTVASVLVIGGLLTYGATNVLNNMSDEQLAEMQTSGGEGALEAGILLSARKSPEEVNLAKMKEAKVNELMQDANPLTRLYGSKRDYLLNEKKMSKKDVDYLLGPSLDEEEPTATPVKPPAVPKDFGKLVNPYETPGQTENQNLRPTMQNDPRLQQISSPSSEPISNLSNTNIDLNLPAPAQGTADAAANRNVNSVNSKSKEKSGLKPSQISVRNDEESYQEMILDSMRMI
jgi:hypothetical protein